MSYAQAGRNIEDALGRAGATLSDIVSVRQWLTNAADIPAYAAVRSSIITHQPVFMLALVWPNIWVEIKVPPRANRALMTAQYIYFQEDTVE